MPLALAPPLLVLLLAGVAQLPTQPDFSGEWVVEGAAPAGQAVAISVQQTLTATTVRGEPMPPFYSSITIERRFTDPTHSESRTFYIGAVGGTVPGIPVAGSAPQGEWTTESVRWDGDRLVIKTTRSPQPPQQTGPRIEHEEVWALDPNGRLLMTITDRGSGSPAATGNLTYKRPDAQRSPRLPAES